ncbi:MAG: 1,4-alpha-glucan branching enzyme [Solirubrobacterales bacterium]|jgi:1,4-alpha-glucan branching enzyme|nr:1,4-alpha-glucan branching enzyme [Solirubrobacterales bacterium]
MPDETHGDLAIVLHSHMPYVEGFGTYPFGEEWLFDAACRSYLPILEVADRLTMTVTPVLADQLEDPGVAARLREFVARHRLGGAEIDARDAAAELQPAARAWAERYARVVDRLDSCEGNVVSAFAAAQDEGRIALMASAASHAVLPLVATEAGRRLQIDAGLRSHRRRFGPAAGFWLPECAYEPGLERLLAERSISYFCSDQSAAQSAADDPPLAPIATAAGPVAMPIDWPTVRRVWSWDGYPSDPVYAEHHSRSQQGTHLWSIAKQPYDPGAAAARAREQAAEFAAAVAERLAAHRERRGHRGLLVFAIDTELLGDWWSEGPIWLAELLSIAADHGISLVTLPQALAEHDAAERALLPSSWGENKDLSTWDSPEVSDLAWASRRLELRLLRAVAGNGLSQPVAERATRELLACQASDWAFIDKHGQAGDYGFQRAVNHAAAMLDALDCDEPPSPRMRNLAPDLSLVPLLEP